MAAYLPMSKSYSQQLSARLQLMQFLFPLVQFTVPAVEGFFRSIALSHGSSLQDTLRLLTLWFDYGQWLEVYDAIVEGKRTTNIDTWLQVTTTP